MIAGYVYGLSFKLTIGQPCSFPIYLTTRKDTPYTMNSATVILPSVDVPYIAIPSITKLPVSRKAAISILCHGHTINIDIFHIVLFQIIRVYLYIMCWMGFSSQLEEYPSSCHRRTCIKLQGSGYRKRNSFFRSGTGYYSIYVKAQLLFLYPNLIGEEGFP